jgi:glycosyltransferase involved in cell wall biosynthesis
MLLSLSWGIGPGAFFRRDLVDRIGGRNPSRVYCGDMEFWAIAAMQGPFAHVPKLLATHRTHPGSASVGQLSGIFAKEWVATWISLFARPELPDDVRAVAPSLLAKVRISASRNYAGADQASARLLLAQGAYIFPLLSGLRRFPVHVYQLARRFLRGAVTGTLFAEPALDVSIEQAESGAVIRGSTDGIGRYRIENLPAGSYSVTFSSGERQSHMHSGGPFSVQTMAGSVHRSARQFIGNVAMGIRAPARAVFRSRQRGKTGTVTGTLFAEPALEVIVEQAESGAVIRGSTDGIGRYRIENLPAGSYSVTFSSGERQSHMHSGGPFSVQTTAGPVGSARRSIANVAKGIRAPARAAFRPTRRSNGGAAPDAGLVSIIGVSIKHDLNGEITSANADATGSYCIAAMPAGPYTVTFSNGEVQHVEHSTGGFAGRSSMVPPASGAIPATSLATRLRRLSGPPLRFVRTIKSLLVHILNRLFSVRKPGINVVIARTPNGRVQKARTDGSGQVVIKSLPKGTYTVSFANGEVQTHGHPGGRFAAMTATPPVIATAPDGLPTGGRRLLATLVRALLLLGGSLIRRRYRLRPGIAQSTPGFSYRIAICTRFTPPLWSGQAVMLGRLINGMPPDRYCMVSLPLYPETGDKVGFTPPLPGIRYLLPSERDLPRLPIPARWQHSWLQIRPLYQAWQRGINIARALQDDPADTIVGCSGDLLDLPAAWLAARLLKVRFAVYFFDDYTEQWWADPPLQRFAVRVERWIMPRATTIMVTNELMQEEIKRRYNRASEIIRNPTSGIKLPDIVERYPAQPDEVRLVFTGAVYHLNYDILRAIIAGLATIPGITHRLHIYTAQAKEQLEAQGLTGPHIAIHPHVTPDEVAEIQRHADILLIPFSFVPEARGIVRTAATAKLADYLAAGRPIMALCPEDAFVAWFLRTRECGITVSSADPSRIAAAVSAILEEPDTRLRMQRNARRAAIEEFDPATAQEAMIRAIGLVKLPAYLRTVLPPKDIPDRIKIVQVSSVDLVGMQVNGFLTHKWLQEQGHDSRLLVYTRMSGDPCVKTIGSSLLRALNPLTRVIEAKLDTTAMLPLLSHRIDRNPWVRDADIVNLQLIHAAPFFSLLDLPRLSRKKRVVLSVHDMFLMTGHCIYSMGCERWKTGCGDCPDLGIPFAMTRDTTARNWKLKRWVFDRSNVDIVVGSKWQEEHVRESPILGRFRRHMIPYGVDTRVFKPGDKAEARRKLGIPANAHVISFRSAPYHRNFKGTDFIEEALRIFKPRRPTVLIVFEGVGGLNSIRGKYQFHEFGWVIDGETIAGGLQATDVFLMPSIAEAFGLMAIESMACGATPLVFDGTALPDTIGGPDCGVIVPQGDAAALAHAIGDCLDHPEKLARYRENGLRHAVKNHGFDDYARRYLDLFLELAKEKRP